MIIRNDLKNTERYKNIEQFYKQNNKKDAKQFLFWLLPELILISIFSCFVEKISILHAIIICLPLTLFFYFGYVFYCYLKLKEKYEVYQITVEKKIRKRIHGVDGAYQYFIKDIDNKILYAVKDFVLFDNIQEQQTYLFFAKGNDLFEIIS